MQLEVELASPLRDQPSGRVFERPVAHHRPARGVGQLKGRGERGVRGGEAKREWEGEWKGEWEERTKAIMWKEKESKGRTVPRSEVRTGACLTSPAKRCPHMAASLAVRVGQGVGGAGMSGLPSSSSQYPTPGTGITSRGRLLACVEVKGGEDWSESREEAG